MNTLTVPKISRESLPDADRVGVLASVLCAIHCGLAPLLLIFLPAFGKIWAHPASHALVAIFIIPLAIFSIRKGYRNHSRHWVVALAVIGIICVLVGAVLPTFTEGESPVVAEKPAATEEGVSVHTTEEACSSEDCAETAAAPGSSADETHAACVDQCCPSAQISDTGEWSIHVPPAAIVTTLGGLFLIAAHIGNLWSFNKCCESEACGSA